MITFALHVLRLLPFLIGGHRQLALENPVLRQHLAVYKRTTPHQAGRLFWAALARVGPGGGRHWFIVTPAIVLRWQRRRFRDYWTRLSCRPTAGRPPLDADRRRESFLGRPRIHGEFLKLGIEISERTVSMVMPKSRRCPSQP